MYFAQDNTWQNSVVTVEGSIAIPASSYSAVSIIESRQLSTLKLTSGSADWQIISLRGFKDGAVTSIANSMSLNTVYNISGYDYIVFIMSSRGNMVAKNIVVA